MLYILLARLTGDGQRKLLDNPDLINHVSNEVLVPGTQLLARYAVLGRYDFIMLAEAKDAESMARLSLEFGARAGVHIETLQALSANILAEPSDIDFLMTGSLGDLPARE